MGTVPLFRGGYRGETVARVSRVVRVALGRRLTKRAANDDDDGAVPAISKQRREDAPLERPQRQPSLQDALKRAAAAATASSAAASADGLTATAATAPQTAGAKRGSDTQAAAPSRPTTSARITAPPRLPHTGALGGCPSTAETAALRRHSTGPERRQHGQPAQATSHPCGACHSEHREIPDPADHDGRTAQPPTGPPSPSSPTRAPAKSPTKTPRQLSAA